MKLTLVLLIIVAVIASMVYATLPADNEEIDVQEFLEKAMKQSPQGDNVEQELQLQAQLHSFLKLAEMEQESKGTLQEATAKKQYRWRIPFWWYYGYRHYGPMYRG